MEKKFEEVMRKLEADLSSNEQEKDELRRLAKNIQLVNKAMEEVIADAGFMVAGALEEEVQILYNKDRFPLLLARVKLFKKCYDIETFRRYSTDEQMRHYCGKEMERIRLFFTTQREFCEYYYGGQTDNDRYLYCDTNAGREQVIIIDDSQPPVTNRGCLLKASLLAYQEYNLLLQGKLISVVGPKFKAETRTTVTWEYTPTDLAEQVLAQYESDTTHVDGQPATLEFLIQLAASTYGNIDPRKLEKLIQNIRNRKRGPAKHHLRLIASLEAGNERVLDKRPRKTSLGIKRLK
jgi:hypothetical protein